jgi:hypothetical protein
MCNACASSIVRQCTRTRGRQGIVTVVLDVVVASCVAGADQESTGQQAEAESPAAVRQRLEAQQQRQQKQRRRQADSTDWFASTLTRRFGLAGGLAWLGFLSFGVISEQVLGFQTMPGCDVHSCIPSYCVGCAPDTGSSAMFVLPRGAICRCTQIKTRLEVAADEKGTQVRSALVTSHHLPLYCHMRTLSTTESAPRGKRYHELVVVTFCSSCTYCQTHESAAPRR